MKVDIIRDNPPITGVSVHWTATEAKAVYWCLCHIDSVILGTHLHNLRLQLGAAFNPGGN